MAESAAISTVTSAAKSTATSAVKSTAAAATLAPTRAMTGLDLETRLTQDHHQSLKLWLRMLSCTVRIESEIRSRLRGEFDITLPRFDLMAQLERHPQGLRMGELSRRMMVTGGNITGITDQLEQEKLVVRQPDPQDRRAYSVMLTAEGHRAFVQMAARHESWVTELLGGLAAAEKGKLIELLSQIKDHLNESALEKEI